MTIYGYVRKEFPVETTVQLKKIMEMNCDEIVIEEAVFLEKKELMNLIDKLQIDDTLIVYDLLVFYQEIVKFEKIIHFLADSNIRLISLMNQIDTKVDLSFYKDVMIVNDMHVNLIRHRTQNNIKQARKRGVEVGRPKIKTETIEKIKYLHDNYKYSLRRIADECAVSIGTAYKYVNQETE